MEAMQFGVRILGSEAPDDGGSGRVAVGHMGGDVAYQSDLVGAASLEARPGQIDAALIAVFDHPNRL